MTANRAEYNVGRILEPWRFGLQRGGVEEANRHVIRLGQPMQRLLVGLEIDGKDAGDGFFREAGRKNRIVDEFHEFLGRHAALTADTDGDRTRVVDEVLDVSFQAGEGNGDLQFSGEVGIDPRFGKPGRLSHDPNRFTGEHFRHEGFDMLRVDQFPARWRIVERDPETEIARRCDGRRHAEGLAKCSRDVIGAMMAAQKRHDRAAVLGQRDHRRIVTLVGKPGRQCTDQNSCGTDADDSDAVLEQAAQMAGHIVERRIRVVDPSLKAMNGGIG